MTQKIYLVSMTSSEGYESGRESLVLHNVDPIALKKEAYLRYSECFAANQERLDDESDILLTFAAFSDLMDAGFDGNPNGYALIQCDDCHFQFEASSISAPGKPMSDYLLKTILRKLHDAGGCDGSDGYDRGYDDAIGLSIKLVLEATKDAGYDIHIEDVLDD